MVRTQTVGHSKTHSHLHAHKQIVLRVMNWNGTETLSERNDHGHWHFHEPGAEKHDHLHDPRGDFWPHRAADVVEVVPGEEREHRR